MISTQPLSPLIILKADELAWQAMLRVPGLLEIRDRFGNTLLLIAIKKGLSKRVRTLLRMGASPLEENAKGKNSTYYALRKFNFVDRDSRKIVRDLMLIGNCKDLWRGVIGKVLDLDILERHNVASIFSQLFFWTVECNCESFVKFLLSQGVGIDCRTSDDWTALHYAIEPVGGMLARQDDEVAEQKN